MWSHIIIVISPQCIYDTDGGEGELQYLVLSSSIAKVLVSSAEPRLVGWIE